MRWAAYALLGTLALIGAFVVAVNFGWNMGAISACGTPSETAASSPDGRLALIVAVSNCGMGNTETKARVVSSSGKTYLVFWGAAETDGSIVQSDWFGPTKLRLSYSPSAEIKFPVGDLDGLHVFGDLEVTYERL